MRDGWIEMSRPPASAPIGFGNGRERRLRDRGAFRLCYGFRVVDGRRKDGKNNFSDGFSEMVFC